MSILRLGDAEAAADLGRYAQRAKRLDPDGGMRLQALGSVLAAWVRVLPGDGLTQSGLVLGLRTIALAEPADLDLTVPIGAITDRIARDASGDLPVPPATLTEPWAVVTPPRAEWEDLGTLDQAAVREAARAGIDEVAQGAPEGSGAALVAELRRRVWARPTPTEPAIAAGGALGLYALGFLVGDAPVRARRQGPWTRLSTPFGHVVVRR